MRTRRISARETRPSRVRRTGRRLAAAFTASVLVVLLPSQPAIAQEGQEDPAQEEQGFAEPPPLPENAPIPPADGNPDVNYTRGSQGCVVSAQKPTDVKQVPWAQERLNFDELEEFATGKGIKVAVIDTGVKQHSYFRNKVVGLADYVRTTDDGPGLEDCDGHGTQVAGIIAGNPPNDEAVGFRGIARDVTILSIRQTSSLYEFKHPTDEDKDKDTAGNIETLAKAVVHAADADADVINMSVDNCRPAGPIQPQELKLQAALRYAVEVQDAVVVSSASNLDGSNKDSKCGGGQNSLREPNKPDYIVTPPWFSEYVLSVAAMNDRGEPAGFTRYGPWVSVAAPGTKITTLNPGATTGLANATADSEGNLGDIQGTSFAAPYVSGLAALIRERFKDLDAKEVMNRIMVTAAHPAAPGGRNSRIGYGMINPVAALTAIIPSEQGIAPDEPTTIPANIPPPNPKDWTPVQVAMIGTGGGFGLLLLTVFIVHTVRRNRRDPNDPGRGTA